MQMKSDVWAAGAPERAAAWWASPQNFPPRRFGRIAFDLPHVCASSRKVDRDALATPSPRPTTSGLLFCSITSVCNLRFELTKHSQNPGITRASLKKPTNSHNIRSTTMTKRGKSKQRAVSEAAFLQGCPHRTQRQKASEDHSGTWDGMWREEEEQQDRTDTSNKKLEHVTVKSLRRTEENNGFVLLRQDSLHSIVGQHM